ncbi:glycosyltransferase [Novosphingobium clariflavum]|uniref:Glycosyltransferase n=1 Tax=Novosphingobium clariflavum TaxID=2029884 RepID=A0ABV6SBD3_9SPHN|nr:glycosyltransferase [Novosphingobium clariflavum]
MKPAAELKVLHVCECLPGGPGSYLQEVLPAQLAKLGAGKVAVLAPESQLGLLPADGGLVTFSYDQESRSASATVRLARQIRHAVRQFAPDVLHLHSTLAGALGRTVTLGMRRRPKIVYCAHGWMIDPDKPVRGRGLIAAMERSLSRFTDSIVNISPHEAGFLLDRGFARSKLDLVVSGIRDFPAPPPVEPQERPVNLLFIGRLDYQKGFDLLLPAIARLPEGLAKVTVVGDVVRGGVRPGIEGLAIDMKGWLPREEVAKAIVEADAVVMPSRWEGLPLVALETMRAGRALIATNGGAFRHLVQDGETGALIDNGDPQFLVDTLSRYGIADFRRMGIAARAAYEAGFRADRMNEELLGLYRELAAA